MYGIARNEKKFDGSPHIEKTDVQVWRLIHCLKIQASDESLVEGDWDVVEIIEVSGDAVLATLATFDTIPHFALANAVRYYADHREEVDAEIKANTERQSRLEGMFEALDKGEIVNPLGEGMDFGMETADGVVMWSQATREQRLAFVEAIKKGDS